LSQFASTSEVKHASAKSDNQQQNFKVELTLVRVSKVAPLVKVVLGKHADGKQVEKHSANQQKGIMSNARRTISIQQYF
jgi:hypothetical protein